MARKSSYTGKYKISKVQLAYVKAYSLQYPEWLDEYNALKDSVKGVNYDGLPGGKGSVNDATLNLATKRAELREKMLKVEHAAHDAGGDIAEFILKSVIFEDMTFEDMKAIGLPCERTMFYARRRKYYFLLSKEI
jgi:hypothetical protein